MRRPPFLGGGRIRSCGQLFSFPSSSFDFGWTLSWTWRLFISQVVGRGGRMFLAAESDVYCDMFLIWVPFCLVLPGATWPWKDGQASDFSCPFISWLLAVREFSWKKIEGVCSFSNRARKGGGRLREKPSQRFLIWFFIAQSSLAQLKTKTFLGSKWNEAAAWVLLLPRRAL
jgi:hypothetical protein